MLKFFFFCFLVISAKNDKQTNVKAPNEFVKSKAHFDVSLRKDIGLTSDQEVQCNDYNLMLY